VSRPAARLRRTFSAIGIPNFRRFFCGQSISLIGTWMQSVAQSWLVYTLTHSSTALGAVVALQALPVLLLGPYAGVIADRTDKRRLMVVLQSLMGVQALLLGLLASTHVVTFWEVCLLATALGLNNTFENPARQSFVLEMVGGENVRNAVSLSSTMVNAARAVGPATAGLVIATAGVGACFLINALSFAAVVYSLVSMDRKALCPSKPAGRAKGQLRDGLSYVAHEPQLGVPLLMMAFVGTLAYEFQVSLPVLARQIFHGGAETYGFLTAAMGAGAVLGGLVTATRGKTGLHPLTAAVAVFGAAVLAAALSPVLAVEYVALALVGWGSVSFLATGNSTLQLTSAPSMRGRVMALWAVAFLGSTPIGGPVIGWVIAVSNARLGLGVGAMACMVAAVLGFVAIRRTTGRATTERTKGPSPAAARAAANTTTGPATTDLATTDLATTDLATTDLAAQLDVRS
jgi:MFS family permease